MKTMNHACSGSAMIALLLLLIVSWIVIDAGYAWVVGRRLAAWEAGIPRDANGVREGCEAFSVGDGDTAILLVHGFGDSPAVFRPMAEALAREGFHCRALRLPGFAEPMDAYAQTSEAQWSATVAAELDALRAAHDEVHLVAHSLGGAIALRHVLDHPDAADSLVLLAPLLGVSNERSPVLPSETWYRLLSPLMVRATVLETIFEPNFKREDASPQPTDRFVPNTVYRGLFRILDDVRGRADALETRTKLYIVPDDPVVDADATEAFVSAAPPATAETVRLTASGHVVPMDQEWQRVTREIAAFVRRE